MGDAGWLNRLQGWMHLLFLPVDCQLIEDKRTWCMYSNTNRSLINTALQVGRLHVKTKYGAAHTVAFDRSVQLYPPLQPPNLWRGYVLSVGTWSHYITVKLQPLTLNFVHFCFKIFILITCSEGSHSTTINQTILIAASYLELAKYFMHRNNWSLYLIKLNFSQLCQWFPKIPHCITFFGNDSYFNQIRIRLRWWNYCHIDRYALYIWNV